MDNKSLYKALVSAGMTPEGACAMLGNWRAESAMRPNNAQDGMTKLTDAQYTAAADAGTINFVRDAVGYGYAQWTFWSRKEKLLAFCKKLGRSVGDGYAQVQFAIHELQTDYKTVWYKLCREISLEAATELICVQYERPAINNIAERTKYAKDFYSQFAGVDVSIKEPANAETAVKLCTAELPMLMKGCKGPAVESLQTLLELHGFSVGPAGVDGDYGTGTQTAVKKLQYAAGKAADGIVGRDTWPVAISGV